MCDNIKNLIYLNLNNNFSFKKIFNLLAPFLSQFLYLLNISNVINYKSMRDNNKYIIINFIIDIISITGIFSNILDSRQLNYSDLALSFILFIIFIFIFPYILFSFLFKRNKISNLLFGIIIIYLQILGHKLFYCLFRSKEKKKEKKPENITKLEVTKAKILNLPEYINIDLNESKEIQLEIEGDDNMIIDSEIRSDNIQIYPDWLEIDNINKKVILKSTNEIGFYNVKLIVNSNSYVDEYELLIIRSDKKPKINVPKNITFNENEYYEFNLNLEDDSINEIEINIKLYKNDIIIDPTWFIFDSVNKKIIFDQVPSNFTGNYKIYIDILDNKDNVRFLEVIDVLIKKI